MQMHAAASSNNHNYNMMDAIETYEQVSEAVEMGNPQMIGRIADKKTLV